MFPRISDDDQTAFVSLCFIPDLLVLHPRFACSSCVARLCLGNNKAPWDVSRQFYHRTKRTRSTKMRKGQNERPRSSGQDQHDDKIHFKQNVQRSTVNDKTPSGQEKRNQKRQARRKATTTHSKHSLPSARGGHMIFHSQASSPSPPD